MGCLTPRPGGGACNVCDWVEASSSVSPLHLAPRTILHGQYLVARALGQGGFGITYLAWDLQLEMRVAIKEFLPTDFASRASGEVRVVPYGEDGRDNFDYGLESFETEARTLARFVLHPGVVPIHNYFRENGTGYIVMHYLQGRTLRDLLRDRGGRIASDEALTYIAPVLDTLSSIHATGLLHRDISPDNIYVCDTGRVCVLDFGAARHAVRQRSRSLSVQFKAGYTPEEQFRRRGEQGPWTDVYAVAATLFRAITGDVPQSALDRLQDDRVTRPSTMASGVPAYVDAAIMRGLALRAERRFRTIEDLARALAVKTPVVATPPSPAERTVRTWSSEVSRAGTWFIAVAVGVARAVRVRVEALAQHKGAVDRERSIREELGKIAPVILVSLAFRAPHLPAGQEHGPYDIYARDHIHEVTFEATLQNTCAGINAAKGVLGVAFVDPAGIVSRGSDSPERLSLTVPVDLHDRETYSGSWRGSEDGPFQSGQWRVELFWGERKIGDRVFIVSQ
ncbi:MAG: serine/threonine-protein kinase [Vicinamibacterales bacterium]